MKLRSMVVLILTFNTVFLFSSLEWNVGSQGGTLLGTLPEPQVTTVTSAQEEYSILTLPQSTQSGLPGAYSWPVLQHMVQLPATDNLSYTINDLHYTEMPLDLPLAPFNWEDDDTPEHIYSSQDAWLPHDPIEIAPAAIMRGIRFTTINVHPVQYNPARNTIRYLTTLDCQFQLDASRAENPLQSISHREAGCFGEMAQTMLDYTPQTRSTNPEKYLFVCPDNVMQIIQPLAQWKQKLGFLTHITPMSEIGTEPTDVQNYLQNAYDTWDVPPTYVILFGNRVEGIWRGDCI